MDNPKKPRGSFFKRASDAETRPAERPTLLDNSEYTEQVAEREARPSAARRTRDDQRNGSRRSSTSDRPRAYGDKPRAYGEKPRTPGADFRKKVEVEPKEAPENVIYGIHPVREALEIGTAIEKIYIRRTGDDRENGARTPSGNYSDNAFGRHAPVNNVSLDVIRSLAAQHNVPVQEVPVEKLDRLTRRNPHQGVVAVVPSIEYADLNELADKLAERDIPALVIVVDGVTDVRNFGAIARSAECAGADAIIMGAKNSAPVNAEAMKSSAGALNIIPVCRVGSIRNALRTLQMAGMQLVAATEKSNDLLFEADFTQSTVIIMGGEDRGISSEVLNMCDRRIAIPMLGKIESLNVSAAAAVLLYEVVRQRFEAIEA